jgi:hypothetical protein
MIFLRPFWPRALAAYHMNLIWLSLASDPELAKNTLPTGKGAISLSFSASAMPGSVALAAEDMREGQLAHLLGRGLHQLFLAPAQRRCTTTRPWPPDSPCHCVIDKDAFAALDHQRTGLAQGDKIGKRMQQAAMSRACSWTGLGGRRGHHGFSQSRRGEIYPKVPE